MALLLCPSPFPSLQACDWAVLFSSFLTQLQECSADIQVLPWPLCKAHFGKCLDSAQWRPVETDRGTTSLRIFYSALMPAYISEWGCRIGSPKTYSETKEQVHDLSQPSANSCN